MKIIGAFLVFALLSVPAAAGQDPSPEAFEADLKKSKGDTGTNVVGQSGGFSEYLNDHPVDADDEFALYRFDESSHMTVDTEEDVALAVKTKI